eukprot:5248053-Pleurochrysis_carterae.AAC.1
MKLRRQGVCATRACVMRVRACACACVRSRVRKCARARVRRLRSTPPESRRGSAPHEVGDPRAEGAARHVEVAHDVQRQPVVGADEHEEGEVDEHVEEVGQQLQVEEHHALVLPAPAQTHVVDVERVPAA